MVARDELRGAVTLATVVIGLVVVLGGATATGAPTTATNHGSTGDYTVVLPNEVDHYPGDQNRANASIQHLAALDGVFDGTPSPKGYEAAAFLIIGNEDIDFSGCSTEDTAAFGLDRGNDADGTETDESLLSHRENSEFNEHEIVIDFFDPGALAGEPVSINDVDEVVAVQNECYTMPTEPGWYQINGFLNGTGYDGNEFDVTLDSHYFWVCECGSEAEARQQLGPPPSEEGDGGGGGESTPTATPTATATAEPEATATATAEPGSTAMPEPTATAAPEATATATAEPESTATATAAPEATATDGGSGGNDGGSGGEQDAGGQNAGGGAAATATATAASGGTPAGAPATPTIGAGPGFGTVAALVGLLAAVLLALRRD